MYTAQPRLITMLTMRSWFFRGAQRNGVFPERRSMSRRDSDSLVNCARIYSQAQEHKGSTKRSKASDLIEGVFSVFVLKTLNTKLSTLN